MPRRASGKNNRWPKVLAWTFGSLFLLLVAAWLVGQAWLNRYLRSDEFRARLEERTGIAMRAKVAITPIRIEGTEFFCDQFAAEGAQDGKFSAARVDAIRGSVAIPSLFKLLLGERSFRISNLEVQKLALDFYRDRLPLVLPPRGERTRATELDALTIHDFTIGWSGGGVKGATVRATAVEGGWKIEGHGGRLTQLGLPGIELASARVVWKDPSLFVQDARLRHDGGEVGVSGEIRSDDKADLLFTLSNLNVTTLLPEDWRARLHGRLGGEIRFLLPIENSAIAPPTLRGKLELHNGVIEALPVLAKIAEFTRTDQFRRVPLHTLTADIHYDATGLHVTNIVLESRQLIVVRGGITIADKKADGTFDIGITPGPLQWLPGSQDKVFNTPGGGYAWTKMRITGPLDSLSEDLTPRLMAAAEAATVEKVQNTATKAVETAVDAVDAAKRAAEKAAGTLLTPLFGN